jgi:predicted amidophosphoribosyltransferase
MKHAAGESLSAAVGQLLAARRGGLVNAFDADFALPVPMYWGRRIWRGVNSAEVLAEELGRVIQIPVLSGAIVRSRNTFPQKDLGTSERFRNVRGAFALSRGYGLGDARVLVVDDILTTGATCSEVAKTLKKGGVKAVAAVVVGRASTGS